LADPEPNPVDRAKSPREVGIDRSGACHLLSGVGQRVNQNAVILQGPHAGLIVEDGVAELVGAGCAYLGRRRPQA